LNRRCHFIHVSLKQSQFYHCQTSTAHRQRIKVDGSVAIISIKNFPIGLHVIYFLSNFTVEDGGRWGQGVSLSRWYLLVLSTDSIKTHCKVSLYISNRLTIDYDR
jgi:hypothetical protein